MSGRLTSSLQHLSLVAAPATLVLAVGVGSTLGAITDPTDDHGHSPLEEAGFTLTTVARLFDATATTASRTVTCPAGEVVGGGFQASSDVVITLSYPSAPDQWQVAGHSLSGTRPIFAWAICVTTDTSSVNASALMAPD